MTDRQIVAMREVAYWYDEKLRAAPVLHGLNVRVDLRERIAVVGESGSGKSTLLHLMAGLLSPQRGSVSWPRSDGAIRTAFVFQEPSLIESLDVGQNIALPLLLAGKDRAEAFERAEWALERLQLTDTLGRLPDQLSAGQAQRIAIARGLAMETELFIADEPTGRLDQITTQAVMSTLIDAADAAHFALVVATHDEAVANVCEQRWTIENGSVHGDVRP